MLVPFLTQPCGPGRHAPSPFRSLPAGTRTWTRWLSVLLTREPMTTFYLTRKQQVTITRNHSSLRGAWSHGRVCLAQTQSDVRIAHHQGKYTWESGSCRPTPSEKRKERKTKASCGSGAASGPVPYVSGFSLVTMGKQDSGHRSMLDVKLTVDESEPFSSPFHSVCTKENEARNAGRWRYDAGSSGTSQESRFPRLDPRTLERDGT